MTNCMKLVSIALSLDSVNKSWFVDYIYGVLAQCHDTLHYIYTFLSRIKFVLAWYYTCLVFFSSPNLNKDCQCKKKEYALRQYVYIIVEILVLKLVLFLSLKWMDNLIEVDRT